MVSISYMFIFIELTLLAQCHNMPLYRCPQNVKLIKMYIAAVFHLWQSNQAQNQSRLTLYVSLKSFARCHHQANQKNLPVFLCLPHGHTEKRHQQKPSAVTSAALAVSVVFNNHWLELSFCWSQAAHLFLHAAPSPGICNSLQRARVSQCLAQWTQERVWWDAGTFLHCDTLLQICSSSSSQELGFFFFFLSTFTGSGCFCLLSKHQALDSVKGRLLASLDLWIRYDKFCMM